MGYLLFPSQSASSAGNGHPLTPLCLSFLVLKSVTMTHRCENFMSSRVESARGPGQAWGWLPRYSLLHTRPCPACCSHHGEQTQARLCPRGAVGPAEDGGHYLENHTDSRLQTGPGTGKEKYTELHWSPSCGGWREESGGSGQRGPRPPSPEVPLNNLGESALGLGQVEPWPLSEA